MPRYNLSVAGRKITLAETDAPLSKTIGKRLAGSPDTRIDSGGSVNSFHFEEQEITQSELREIKQIRESGGIISRLVRLKALLNFGGGVRFEVPNNEETTQMVGGEELTLKEWLQQTFDDIETQAFEIGEDALWFPYGAGELVETRAGGFDRVEGVEPWTVIPKTNEKGEIVQWEQTIQGEHNGIPFDPDEIVHFPVNKSSARDKTGISEVLRNKEEIQAFRDNQRAISNAIELHAFPQRHVKVGREGSAPIRDNELRRVRNLFDSRSVDSDTVFVTGQDVNIDALEAENFEFEKVTENDLKQLALAFGLPVEAANVGSDGLGSGKPAELRLTLLKLDIKMTRRLYTNQWVDEVITPVVRDYSPFDHTRRFDMEMQETVESMEDMADLLNKAGEWLESNEGREMLNLEPKDELEGEYGPPGKSEQAMDEAIADTVGEQLEGRELQEGPFTDYPEAASENAQMALDAREETGDPNDCGTDTGWARANQLADREPISEETVSRMSQFSRHQDNSEMDDEEGRADCGWMMWKAWGGDEGIEWAEEKMDELESRENSDGQGGTDFSYPQWEAELMGMHERLFDIDTDRSLLQFTSGQTPEFVKERIRQSVMSGAVFSQIDGLEGSDLMQLREFMRETLTSDGWTIDGLSDQLEQLGIDPERADTIARTETASVLNTAREEGYEEQGQEDSLFYWSGSLDTRTTDACRWLIEETNPHHGGDPVSLDELKKLIDEAPEHDPKMQDNLARPENFVVHPNERKQFVRAPESKFGTADE